MKVCVQYSAVSILEYFAKVEAREYDFLLRCLGLLPVGADPVLFTSMADPMRESLYAQYERQLMELNNLIRTSGNQGDQNLLPVSTKLTLRWCSDGCSAAIEPSKTCNKLSLQLQQVTP